MNFGYGPHWNPNSMTGRAVAAVCALEKDALTRVDVRRAINGIAETKGQVDNIIRELYEQGYLEMRALVTDKAKARAAGAKRNP